MTDAPFKVPTGATAQLYIIDTGLRMTEFPAAIVLAPHLAGLEKLPPFGAWSFLIQSPKGRKALFDLSMPPDAAIYPPSVVEEIKNARVIMQGSNHVADVLRENKMDPAEISSVIWSHHHWDHIGDITTFPSSTELVVGPGFKDAFLPGHPSQTDAWVEERHLRGRTLREITFREEIPALIIGGFRAYDFFEDGSFYLLDTPGHDVGHLAGLVRTTSDPDTFIFLGGDICHHGGEIRPSPHVPIPRNLQFHAPCSVSDFEAMGFKYGRKTDEPFFSPALVHNMTQAVQTIKDAAVVDAQSNIFSIFAHDMAIVGVVDFYPHRANEWKEKGWKDKTHWKFMKDLVPAVIASKSNSL